MGQITLVLGGCKSGKSRQALTLAEALSPNRVFIATCIPFDDELKSRVARHQSERDRTWVTVDEPIRLPETIKAFDEGERVILVDCLTLWLNNLLMEKNEQAHVEAQIEKLIQVLAKTVCPVILVSNEVGAGIVPENRLARLFRDAAGVANQRLAAVANQVIYTVAGIPMVLKGRGAA